MLNLLVHQIFNEASLNLDGNKKDNPLSCLLGLCQSECFQSLGVKQLGAYLCRKPSFLCHCAIRHGGGSGRDLGERKKPSSTLKATSSEMPWRGKFRWQFSSHARFGDSSAVLTHNQAPSGRRYNVIITACLAQTGFSSFKVSVLMSVWSAEPVLSHMESMCLQDNEGGETRS